MCRHECCLARIPCAHSTFGSCRKNPRNQSYICIERLGNGGVLYKERGDDVEMFWVNGGDQEYVDEIDESKLSGC